LNGDKTWTLQKVDLKYLESFEMRNWRRIEKISCTNGVEKESITRSRGREVHSTQNKTKEGYLDWSHHALLLPSKTRYRRKDTIDGKKRKKM